MDRVDFTDLLVSKPEFEKGRLEYGQLESGL
jgi:hypothetical protein